MNVILHGAYKDKAELESKLCPYCHGSEWKTGFQYSVTCKNCHLQIHLTIYKSFIVAEAFSFSSPRMTIRWDSSLEKINVSMPNISSFSSVLSYDTIEEVFEVIEKIRLL